MKAMVVRAPGGTEVLKMETIADPTPGPKDVVIKVDACGVCFHDIVTRNGTLKYGVQMPVILGHEISGTVVDVGRDVRGFRKGDKVATVQRYHICGSCRHCRMGKETLCPDRKFTGDAGMVGGYAEYIAVEDDNVALVPEGVALQDASIVACAVGTILNAMREVGKLAAGESALVTGAGGGLGMHAVQLARLAGAFVIAQTTSPEKAEQIRALGAHEVVVHARGEDFSPRVRKLTGGAGVDVAIDNVGSQLFDSVRRSMGIGGRWILIGQLTGQFVPFNPAQLFLKNVSMLSATSTTRRQLEDCLALVARGAPAFAASGRFAVTHSAAEWKKILGPSRYPILREAATERPFSSPLNKEHRKGVFSCAGCNRKLFNSATKFESGTGWPSFYRPLPGAVETSTDRKLGYSRTEVHCADCGGHLGHVFDDGPRPTGLRYCMNGLAMRFRAA